MSRGPGEVRSVPMLACGHMMTGAANRLREGPDKFCWICASWQRIDRYLSAFDPQEVAADNGMFEDAS